MSDLVKIWSFEHDAWWRAASCGYTTDEAEAGLYPRDQAEQIVRQANLGGQINEKIVEAGTALPIQSAAPVTYLVERAAQVGAEADVLYRDLNAYFKGKSVRILCPRFNGQPCGTSKPKLQGRVLVVASAVEHRGEIFLGFSDYQDSIKLGKVEVLP